MRLMYQYLPSPEGHLSVLRDLTHFKYTLDILKNEECQTILDVGSFDGWLDFLLIKSGYHVHGVEPNTWLADAAKAYAKQHRIKYQVHAQTLQDLSHIKKHDAVLCYQTLQDLPLNEIESFIHKLEMRAIKRVAISLAKLDHLKNVGLWTPSLDIILQIFSKKPEVMINEVAYDPSDTPTNWFITYRPTHV